MISPEDKARIMGGLVTSQDWRIVVEAIDEEIKSVDGQMSLALRKKDFDKASHLNGMREMAEKIKGLPVRIRRKNLGIIDRIKESLDSLSSPK